MTRRVMAALTVTLLVFVAAVGCASDDDGNAPTEETTNDATATATRTPGEGIENLQQAKAQLCPELSDLETDLTEVSASGTEVGQDVLEAFESSAAAFESAAAALSGVGAEDAATAANDLASSLESLSTSGGEDAQARAGEAADGGTAADRRPAMSVT